MPTFQIKPGYLGICFCGKNDAIGHQWMAFDNPRPVPPALEGIMEPILGIGSPVCAECADPDKPMMDR